ncbi:MAG: DUF47 domain-containing protein, partial [Terriglobales bacterium]
DKQKMAKPRTAHSSGLLKFFEPKTDFFALLTEQAETTVEGLSSLHDWLKGGGKKRCEAMHDLEHKADRQKRHIQECLRDTFVTPFDREEIYDISAELDCVINNAKKLVKDMELFDEGFRDKRLIKMSELNLEGAQNLKGSIESLQHDLAMAAELANKARKTDSHVGDVYREVLKNIPDDPHVAQVIRQKHIADRLTSIAERIEVLGEKLLHISIKLG